MKFWLKNIGRVALAVVVAIGIYLSPAIPAHVVLAAPTLTTLGTNQDKAATSPWTALSSLSLTAGDYVFVCDAADSATSGINVTNDVPKDSVYEGNPYAYSYVYGANWFGQTFTTTSAYTISHIKLCLQWADASVTGSFNYYLYATSGGHPSGSPLASGSKLVSELTGDSTYYCLAFTASYALSNSTKYAVVIAYQTGDATHRIIINGTNGDTYANGTPETSINSGSSWSSATNDYSLATYTTGFETVALTADATGTGTGIVNKIWSGKASYTSENYKIVITNTSTAKACCAYKCSGIVSSSARDAYNSNTGSGTTATTNATGTLAQADELVIVASAVEDEIDDAQGTWSTAAGYIGTNAQFAATNGGGDTSNVQAHSAAKIVTATTSVQGSDGTHDSSNWAGTIASYKISLPTVTTQAVSSIAATTATGNGTVDLAGLGAISERGICYSTSSNPPTTADSTSHDHTSAAGAYTESLTGLTEGQLYYARAYVIHNSGTSYGDTVTFYTLPGNPASLASPAQASDSIDLTWTKGTGGDYTMIRYRSDGTYPTSPTDGTEGYFNSGTSTTLTGLSPSTTYKIRAWAVDTTPTPDGYSAGTSDLTQATAAGGGTPSVANSPTTFNLGTLNPSSTYYAKGSAPQNPVIQADCTFYITVSDATADVYMLMNDFTGGSGWNIAAGAPGTNEVRMTAYYVGQNPASGLVLSNAAQLFKADVAAGTLYWDFKCETGTWNEGTNKTGILVISVTAA